MYSGHIQRFVSRVISGWVSVPGADTVMVEFFAKGRALGAALAERDPAAPEPRMLFDFMLPRLVGEVIPDDFRARVDGRDVAFTGLPHLLPVGYLDKVWPSGMVEGWAWWPKRPEMRCALEILVDDKVVAQTLAERERRDLVLKEIGDGKYAFSVPLPVAVIAPPGQVTVSVREAYTGTPLRGEFPFGCGGDALLARAEALQKAGRPELAEAELREALVLLPENLHTEVGLARLVRARGDRPEALAHFEAARRLAPEDAWRWLDCGEELRALGRFDEAAAALAEAQRLAPENPNVLQVLGRFARERGAPAEALAHFEAAAAIMPEALDTWLNIAELQRDAGDFAAAAQTMRDYLARYGEDARALVNLAHTARRAQQPEAALAAFLRAHELAPENADILVELADAAQALGHPEDALRYAEMALGQTPYHPGATLRLAQRALALGEPDRAFEIYDEAARHYPESLELQLGALDSLAAKGGFDEAMARIAALQESFGPVPSILARQIFLCRRAGMHGEALRLARAATAAAGQDAWLWVERFYTELAAGDGAGMRECLERMPVNTWLDRANRSRCAGALAESEWRLTDAVRHYEDAEANPDDLGLQIDLTRVKLLLMDLAGARAHLVRQVSLSRAARRLRGESMNISQSFQGQLLDEFALDDALAARLAALYGEEPLARLPALSALVAESPNSTAAAICLLVSMRQAGLFTVAPLAAGGAIPDVIMKFWDTAEVPEDVRALMESWTAHNPDHELRLFDAQAARVYLAAHYPAAVLEAFNRAAEPAQKSDIFRLAYLSREGGIYSDADDRCAQPVRTILPPGARLVLYQENLGSVGNNFMAAAPGDAVLAAALEEAVEAVRRGDSDAIWLASGPGVLTRVLARHLAAAGALALPPGVVILDRRELNRAVSEHCQTAYKTRRAHWTNAMARRRVNPPRWAEAASLAPGV